MEEIGGKSMKNRKFIVLILTLLLLIFSLNINTTKATDFSGKENYYNSICNGYIAEDSPNRQVCMEYQQYLKNQANNASQILAGLKNQIASVGNDLDAIEATSKEISAQMENLYAQIESINTTIDEIQVGIQTVELSIEEKTEAAEKRKQMILDRIPALAVKANTNQYIDFIMGASDLVDLIQRSSSIETFTKYDKEMIETYQKELEALEAEKEEQERLVEQQKVQLEVLEAQETTLLELYNENQKLAEAYHAQQEALIAQKNEAERAAQAANAAANKIVFTGSVASSGYLMSPIQSGYTSAGTWAYPGGTVHRGLDKACPVGTPIYAPANGVILCAKTGVNADEGGSLGDMSGYPYGGGNTLHILVESNGQVYGITFAHMSRMIKGVYDGKPITQGELIGLTGNTGNSTGPHCHIEVYQLNMSFQEAINYWNTNYDWVWGCGWNTTAYCSSAGCRIRPESLGW